MKTKTVQIDEQLFVNLIKLAYDDEPSAELVHECRAGIEAKLSKMQTNEQYKLSKTAKTAEERSAALAAWYDAKGIPARFRII